jgi:hypothetical protein
MTYRATPATEKQLAFATALINERYTGDKAEVIAKLSGLSTLGAAKTIAKLLALPKIVDGVALESGIYTDGEKIIKVYKGQSGRLLAKLLTKSGFSYLGAAERFCKGTHRMTLDEAKAYGAIYGVCCSCGATLTDENSIEAGIGPVCAKKFA